MLAAALLLSQLSLSHGVAWVASHTKPALVCEVNYLQPCQQLIDSDLHSLLGYRAAMAIPLTHPSYAGVVLLNKIAMPTEQSAYWYLNSISLTLDKQKQLSLWHELGHLHQSLSNTVLTDYQHEVYADLYMIWRIALSQQDFKLAWQQYHRRNIAMLDDPDNISHWTVPAIALMFERYSPIALAQIMDFNQIWQQLLPQIETLTPERLDNYQRLFKQQYHASHNRQIPCYLQSLQQSLTLYLQPTMSLFKPNLF